MKRKKGEGNEGITSAQASTSALSFTFAYNSCA
jgi:hypothetical protein